MGEGEGEGGGGSLVTAETVFMIILLITESPRPGTGPVQAANNDVGESWDEMFTNNFYRAEQISHSSWSHFYIVSVSIWPYSEGRTESQSCEKTNSWENLFPEIGSLLTFANIESPVSLLLCVRNIIRIF